MKTLYQFNITLNLQGPILTKATTPSSFGLDAAVARDIEDDYPIIPGTLVEGRLLESLLQLGEGNSEELFGSATGDASNNEPARGRLRINDLKATSLGALQASISRVAIDGTLGSAKGEMLRVIETPFLPGEKVTFEGTAEMFCANDTEAATIAGLLRMGLLWQTQFGALRTTGFGKVLDAKVCEKAIPQDPEFVSTDASVLDLAIAPLGPLCITKPKIGDNLFESDTIIPGNMLAGAVMQTAKELGIQSGFDGQFDNIRFFHAFPTEGGKSRPRSLPLSTVKAGKPTDEKKLNHVFDISHQARPCLVMTPQGDFIAPAFPIDWKEFGDALGTLGQAWPARELRVRTAIDSEKRKGDEGKLFAWEMIHPFVDDDKKTPVIWCSRIDLSRVDENSRAEVARTLTQALAHLSFLSKTKARCRVAIKAVKSPEPPSLQDGQTLTLVLQTDALLADPRFQELNNLPKSGAISADHMLGFYRDTWARLSDNSLVLSHYFAQQHLEGGNYLGIRFQKKHDRAYNPWLLTDAGSVFVFKVKNADTVRQKLQIWLPTGLPVPDWAEIAFGKSWNENPYRPENGFGEVAVHNPKFAKPEVKEFDLADPILP